MKGGLRSAGVTPPGQALRAIQPARPGAALPAISSLAGLSRRPAQVLQTTRNASQLSLWPRPLAGR